MQNIPEIVVYPCIGIILKSGRFQEGSGGRFLLLWKSSKNYYTFRRNSTTFQSNAQLDFFEQVLTVDHFDLESPQHSVVRLFYTGSMKRYYYSNKAKIEKNSRFFIIFVKNFLSQFFFINFKKSYQKENIFTKFSFSN